MRFFGRDDAPQADFWTWWAVARDRVEAAIEGRGFDKAIVEEVTKAVRGIDPRLAWEFAPGQRAKHALCVTPEGDHEVRPVALRWLATAPPADDTWEYHASRQPSREPLVLEAAGHRVDLGEMRAIASWDEPRRRVDVRLWHPEFPQMPHEGRVQAMFLFLDGLLGEDEVTRWIGSIDALEAPAGGRTPEELRAEVQRRAAEPAGDTWVLGQGSDPRGQPVIVLADVALKRIDHPFSDRHVAMRISIEGGGMPDDALAKSLNAEEDRLVSVLGDAAVLAGRTTTPGERVIHFVAADLDAVKAGIDRWAADAPDWRVKVDLERDPTWSFQHKLGIG